MTTPTAIAAEYALQPLSTQQTILGLGIEIQADSIGSGNSGLPESRTGIPHDLIRSERERLYNELLQGVRYTRLAMGLFYRGLNLDEKNLAERYPGQLEEIREIIIESGQEGAAAEYWSPPPFWKENGSYIGGPLALDIDYGAFAESVVRDLAHIESGGIPILRWGLNNEPFTNNNKFSNVFFPSDGIVYRDAFKAVASKVREYNPDIFIHADSGHGQHSSRVQLFHDDPSVLELVDGWTHHQIGANSNKQINEADHLKNDLSAGKPVYNNEFEYLDGNTSVARMLNTAQSIMNWMTFVDSPTWYWLHALKPTYNSESEGFGLGLWRPADDEDFSKYQQIAPHAFDYLPTNYNAIAGFLRYMPWNSVRFNVQEQTVRNDQRIMGWTTPEGQRVFALTNRSSDDFTFEIDVNGTNEQFSGHRYDANERDQYLGSQSGDTLNITLPSMSIEFWVEENAAKPSISVLAMTSEVCENARARVASCGRNPAGMFKITRSGNTDQTTTVKLWDRSSASMGEDFVPINLEVNFAPRQSTQIIRVLPINDQEGEVTETVAIEVFPSVNYNLSANSYASIGLKDDGDSMANWVNVLPLTQPAEPSTAGVYKLTRTGELSHELTVNLQYGGSATPGLDYITDSLTATFAENQASLQISITTLDDLQLDPDETLTLALIPSDDYYVGSPVATLTYTDNDQPLEIIVDNDDSNNVTIVGDWATSSFSSERIGVDYLHDSKSGKGDKSVTFTAAVPTANNWDLSIFFNGGGNRQTDVPVTIYHSGGSKEVLVDMQTGGQWVSLGEYYFNPNDPVSMRSVVISNAKPDVSLPDRFVIADAIRLQDTGTTIDNSNANVVVTGDWIVSTFSDAKIGNNYLTDQGKPKDGYTVTYPWTVPADGIYIAYIYYNSTEQRATNVPVTITHANGSETLIVDQTQSGGSWLQLNGYNLTAGDQVTVTIDNAGTNQNVIADAIRCVASGSN